MRRVLWPLNLIYGFIVAIRNLFFDLKIFPVYKIKSFVISIGNISVGGTGKTPIAAYVCRELEALGGSLAIVSRGYGGKYNESAVRVDVNRKNAADYFGDEPTMLAHQLHVPVYVGKSRVLAALKSINECHPQTIVADDAFQHRWLHRDLNIVVFDFTEKELSLLPAGNLREQLSSLKRADFIFVTRASHVSLEEKNKKLNLLKNFGFSHELQNLYFVEFDISKVVHINTSEVWSGKNCFLLSAIGKPEVFAAAMKNKYSIHNHFIYRDHYFWNQIEWDNIIEHCLKLGGHALLVTEKDAVKIRNLESRNYPIYTVQTHVVMDKNFNLSEWLSLPRINN